MDWREPKMKRDDSNQTGFFLFSLDTELAWGHYDQDDMRAELFSNNGARERKSINILLDIMDEFDIATTWAVTGHLFYEKCQECDICPVLDWKDKYKSFDEIYNTGLPLWYGANIIETLLERGAKHEIAFHGYTHQEFDESITINFLDLSLTRDSVKVFNFRRWANSRHLISSWGFYGKIIYFLRSI